MKTLSKSRFISGVQCRKKIWFDFNRKDLKLPVDEAQQRIFDAGHRVGILAWEKFPNGKDATPTDYSDFTDSIENTKQWISEGVETIYEATFSANNGFCLLDILHREGDELWAIEVKNSTSVKDYHQWDAAFQYFVMRNSGVVPDRFFLMHIDNQYVKNGEITPEIFHLEDITETVLEKQDWVEENLQEILETLESEAEPNVEIGGQCGSPFSCEFQHHCWKHIPENSVFELTNARGKQWELYRSGILKIEDIEDNFPLSASQNLQYRGLRFGEHKIDRESIRDFLSQWEFPLYFFDFETINPMLPVLDGTRPYQQIPFQYSLHILQEDGTLAHQEFLARPEDFSSKNDPRKQLILAMRTHFGASGNVVVYNQTFEITRLRELALAFPEDADFLYGIIDRMVDLMVVFQKKWYYAPMMNGSYSIKYVLPAMAPEFSYKNLEIQDGGTASALYQDSVFAGNYSDENLAIHLLKYCELDTMGMVVIYRVLKEL